MEIKFFPRDRISGSMKRPGDCFVAMFMGNDMTFQVVSVHNGFVMAVLA